MIKIIGAAIKHPRNRALPEFQEYSARRRGPMFARTPHLRGYIQHIAPLDRGGSWGTVN